MASMNLEQYDLEKIAAKVGTPYYLYDADLLRQALGRLEALAERAHLTVRYAMKANSAHQVLQLVRAAGFWIDAVSGNEVVRALRAGFPAGNNPPAIMLTADVYRDNAMAVILDHGVMPNLGSPGQMRELALAGYRGPVTLRINPGFGHGHVQACDTGGPSSKHGIWHQDPMWTEVAKPRSDGMPVVGLHAHIGTGPDAHDFERNMRKLADLFASLLPRFPDLQAVTFGGGLPHPYRPGAPAYDLDGLAPVLAAAGARFGSLCERPIRVEIEPGRYVVAGMGILVSRAHDIKSTLDNEKGRGHRFVMVDAGFCDLVRPAMYGSYHHISIVGRGAHRPCEPLVVAGPLCESGDVFTRDQHELIEPRSLPLPEPGDLVVLHDAGAYGAAMSSNYVSQGRVPEVLWDRGQARLIARRETVDDLVRRECNEEL